jgi:SAM-dependent methyltransferase
MEEWFSSWFDTKYYHILYKNRDFSEAETFISNLVNDLKIEKNSQILDLACGKGRHSIYLNKLGYQIDGCDLSKESITYAKQFENDKLHFFVHDMREPLVNKSYCYVFNLFTSIGYFDDLNDNIKMLQSIESYTLPNGTLVIDFMNASKVINNLVKKEIKKVDGISFNITREVFNGFIIKTIKFVDEGQSFEFKEKVQAIKLADFENYLSKTNFNIIKTCGNYNLDNFDVENSDRLIIFAKK